MSPWLALPLLVLVGLGALLILRGLRVPGRAAFGAPHLFGLAELPAARINAIGWEEWTAYEDRLFATLAQQLPSCAPVQPWQRSQRLLPAGRPIGAVVLLHGLSDSPWSLHHFAEAAQRIGLAAIVPRLPGHATVPASLAHARPEQWKAVTALALKEAARLADGGPVSLVGYSNGAALALLSCLTTAMPIHRLVLISPMIGVSGTAALAGLAALPATIGLMRTAAWLRIGSETNPFKYNSFPLSSARHGRQISEGLQQVLARPGAVSALPPLLIAQSVADATVRVDDLSRLLLARLTMPGHRLILYGTNPHAPRAADIRPDLAGMASELGHSLPPALEVLRITGGGDGAAIHSNGTRHPGQWPDALLTLAHVALPFPPDDPVFGIPIGTLARQAHAERGAVRPGTPPVPRITCNPGFPFLLDTVMNRLLEDSRI